VLADADDAALYDLMNPWDPSSWPADRFYHELVMAADSVLDVGCGTGAMLAYARAHGHRGRLAGIDPDPVALDRARRYADVEWVLGAAADADWTAEFELATMTGHAFQCLVADHDVRACITAIRASLSESGRFVFESRHPQARAWEDWNPANVSEITDPAGRPLRTWHEVQSVQGDVVTFTGTAATLDGTVLGVESTSLRFLNVEALGVFLAEAGFEVEAQYGDWQRGPITSTSREIVTVARHCGVSGRSL